MNRKNALFVVLVILDGWGLTAAGEGNAVSLAKTANLKRFMNLYPHGKLRASGEAVGLPRGEDGNSETGHMNLGAGRIVYQDLPRINMAIADGSFFDNDAFLKCAWQVKKNGSKMHLMGLIGQGGVHSSNDHLYALLKLCKEEGLKDVYLHLFTDGRDSPPNSALFYLKEVEKEIGKVGVGKIATLIGRYFAMDRDNNWQRTKKAYELLTEGKGNYYCHWQKAIEESYEKKITDEFLEPIVIEKEGRPVAKIEDKDGVIFFNYRIDRPRQLTKAFVISDLRNYKILKPSFDPYTEKYYKKTYVEQVVTETFDRKVFLKDLCFVTMTEYEKNLPVKVAFKPVRVMMPLSRVISQNDLRQIKAAETEKERFVTYYFNGQKEDPFLNEDRLIVPSPNVATYDLKPEMSAYELTELFLNRFKKNHYSFGLINFANPDMVGHTGKVKAAVKACEVVDECLGKIEKELLKEGGCILVTADHGNVEEMINLKTGEVDTEHSSNPVPFVAVWEELKNRPENLSMGILGDVAVTVLSLLGIEKDSQMTGRDLLKEIY